jgi:hypothetical protein
VISVITPKMPRDPWKWLAVVVGVGLKLAAILALGFYAVRMSRS